MWQWSSPIRLAVRAGGLATVAVLVAACSGGEKAKGGDTTATAMPSPATGGAPAGSTSTAAPAGSTGTAAGGGATASGGTAPKDPKVIALGDSIFHGKAAGGLCYTCHGPDAKGTQLAPDLTDNKWATGDGSYNFIVQRVTQGMPNPTPPYTAPMPPLGGASLTPQQVQAVSAYVYSLSHKG
ncbi:MAG TPA: c-type cytochrome [Gemmatimonadaceae bacterium]